MAATDDVNSILSAVQLKALRDAWNDPTTQPGPPPTTAQMRFKGRMATALPSIYPSSKALLGVVADLFYKALPDDTAPPPRDLLSERDRERCVIALLAGREINSNIALHMYVALMLEVSPSEIAHILLLAGLYSGIPAFTDSVEMEEILLQFLAKRIQDLKPIAPDLMFDDLRALQL